MTDYQNELVMEHLDLVNWVIRTRISVPNRPLLTYDDFYAIGCEAICRAALKYQADIWDGMRLRSPTISRTGSSSLPGGYLNEAITWTARCSLWSRAACPTTRSRWTGPR